MNEIIESLYRRKSTRLFSDQPVSPDEKLRLLRCAAQAPTAGNQQLYTIIDVTDAEKKQQLAASCDNQGFIAKAPVVLVFLADGTRWQNGYRLAGASPRAPGPGDLLLAFADACIAAQNVVIAAESMGIGSCYIGDILENKEQQRRILDFPATCVPACMLVLGYPAPSQRERKKPPRFDVGDYVCENRYTALSDSALRSMFERRENLSGSAAPKPLDAWLRAFCERKYNSAFSDEMNRSAREYLKEFEAQG
ncbi:MAG: nitroreductase family protein [Ruthenibacterium sp.]